MVSAHCRKDKQRVSCNVNKLIEVNQEVGLSVTEVKTKYVVVGRGVSLENKQQGLTCVEPDSCKAELFTNLKLFTYTVIIYIIKLILLCKS